jgi:hypothetical protein
MYAEDGGFGGRYLIDITAVYGICVFIWEPLSGTFCRLATQVVYDASGS